MKSVLSCLSFFVFALVAASVAQTVSGPVPPAPLSQDAKARFPGYPPLRGIDFWNLDAMHVPAIPTKNFLANPSFRQGLRYWWKMMYGAVIYTPTDLRRFEVVDTERGKALLIRTEKQVNASGLLSVPVPLEPGKTYTLSCYAKSDRPQGSALTLAINDTEDLFFWRHQYAKDTQFPVTDKWQRYSTTFTITQVAPDGVYLNANPEKPCGNIYVTDFQLEEGPSATAFVAPEIEGLLKTSSPSNTIYIGDSIGAKFETFGQAAGKLRLKLVDYWQRVLWEKEYALPLAKEIALPFDELKIGTGAFCVQATYALNNKKTYDDYYRFTVGAPLSEKWGTRDFCGVGIGWQTAWDDLLTEQYARIGFRNVSYMNNAYSGRDYADTIALLKKNNIVNQCSFLIELSAKDLVSGPEAQYFHDLYEKTTFTPEDEKKIEDIARRLTLGNPYIDRFALSCEGETHSKAIKAGNWDEWEKAVMAAWRGVKSARKDAQFFPDVGTSCYLPNRGYRETEEFLKMGQRNHVKWDFVAVHPYSVLDGSYFFNSFMLDESLGHLVETMKSYGYGKETLIYVSEAFNLCTMGVPPWRCGGNADIYGGARASYDFSRMERKHAAWAIRTYLICLKYYPQLPMVNLWMGNFSHDCTGNFIALPAAVNAFHRLFPNPRFVCDFQPADGVFVYAFKGKDGKTTAALWTNRELVEKEQQDGVEFKFNMKDPSLFLVDFMGNRRRIHRDEDGNITVKLDAAPMYLIAKDGEELVSALKDAESALSASSLHVSVVPRSDGSVAAKIENKAKVPCRFSTKETNEEIPAFSSTSMQLQEPGKNAPGTIYPACMEYRYQYPKLPEISQKVPLIYGYAPYSKDAPDWQTVPGFPLFGPGGFGSSDFGADFSARCQIAWNENNFYVRICAKDAQLCSLTPEQFKKNLANNAFWLMDGALELYLDAGGNGKANDSKGLDNDDYRYDFVYATPDRASGKGAVYRRFEPNAQLMGGTDAPTKEEAAKNIGCDFEQTPDGYVYTLTLPKRYLTPMALKPDTHFGFALSLNDIDPNGDRTAAKHLTLSESGLPNEKPEVWASIILVK